MRRILACAAGDDHSAHHDGAGGVADVQVAAAIGFPDDFAAAGAERDDVVVPGYEKDLVAIERDAALALSESVAERPGLRQRMAILPQEISSHRIDGLDHIAGITEIHHAVVDKRRGFVRAGLHIA